MIATSNATWLKQFARRRFIDAKSFRIAGQSDRRHARRVMMASADELAPDLGVGAACRAVGLWRGVPARSRAQAQRAALVGPHPRRAPRPRPALALDPREQQALLDELNSERFCDTAPAAVHATLLDEGRYLGSVRTMYRLLASTGSAGERRRQLTHPAYVKPELLATAPNHLQPPSRGLADRRARKR